MICIRLTFLLLILLSLSIHAQTQPQTSEKINEKNAYKFDEYGKISNKKLKLKLSDFIKKVLEEKSTTGFMAIYAPDVRKRNLRADAIMKFLRLTSRGAFFDFDVSRLTFISVESEVEKTEFWVIPKGAEPPTFESKKGKL